MLVVGVVVLGALGILKTYRVFAASMEPTLRCARPGLGCSGSHDDRVLVLRYPRGDPGRGDLVAFHAPPLAAVRCGTGPRAVFLQRVIGLPGERFAERRGRVVVNGKPLAEPYVEPKRRDARTVPPLRIPAGRYVMLGDDRSATCDSRIWGTVRRRDVIGKLVLRYWPPDRIGLP